MVGARNNFQFQFLCEADLGGVVAVERDAFKDSKEIASKLPVPVLRNGISVTPPPSALCGDGFVHGAEKSELLRRRSANEIPSEKFVALFVDAGETIEKILALIVDGPFRKNDVDKFIDARSLGAGRVRFRNDLINHGDDRVILMSVQRAQRVSRASVRSMQQLQKFT